MKTIFLGILVFFAFSLSAQNEQQQKTKKEKEMNYKQLTEFEHYVIIEKGTERPFTGKYYDFKGEGTYVCKQCRAPLYRSSDKFDAHCGWPSFDDEIEGAVLKSVDADGRRTEITCANCGGHLGHVFYGEGFTDKDTRHCVNSVSIEFIPAEDTKKGEQ
ncbi:methionine-R-sulfoxide reductase [Maribellus mangrovi]|uniref:methionine-R-sulfoxide reductase n=1 Tax=Maribellus mangrovi TaxID=3133146 RepID=UPI0030EC9208